MNFNNKYKDKFYDIYLDNIRGKLAEFEVERRRKLSEVILYSVVSVILSLLGFFLIIMIFRVFPILIFFCCLLLFIPPITCIAVPLLLFIVAKKKFTAKLKVRCMSRIVTAFENMRWYDGYPSITDDEIKESQLLSAYAGRTSLDSFEGVYNNVPFWINETIMYDTGIASIPVFKGVLIKFKANKKIKNTTIVASKYDIGIKNNAFALIVTIFVSLVVIFTDIDTLEKVKWSLICIISLFLSMLKMGTKKKKEVLSEMKLEDPEFNKKYKAYSSNQIEGRYIITPAFMERFQRLQTAFGATLIKCSFYRDNIMFAITTNKNLFEIGKFTRSLDEPEQMEEFFNELSSILEMTDYLKLDEKIGI